MENTREQTTGYWCHMCNQMVDPIMEVETIKCPLCLGGFVEEMGNPPDAIASHNHYPTNFQGGGFNSDRSLSLWAPVLLGMMSNPRRRRNRLRRLGSDEEEDDDQVQEDESDNIHHHYHHHHHHHLDHGEEEIELNRELESIVRRRRSSATILQLLQGIRAGMQFASEGNAQSDVSNRDRSNNRDRDRVILINPFNQTIIVQSSYGVNNNTFANQNQNSIGSLGDYFIGPGLDLLLQHLAENDPNRYGTPPAQKDAVEAMPTVRVEDNLQCSVCLEDFDIGAEAKEMPCKHKFHASCILPWLEIHSSCPICRHQLPVDESKLDSGVSRNNSNGDSTGETSNGNNTDRRLGEGNSNEDGRRLSVALPWRLSSLFSFSDSAAANANSSSAISSADSSTNPFGSSTRTDENGV